MGVVSRTADLFYAFRFLKLLVTPWNKTKAYEFGIVDENGKVLKKARDLKTGDEKATYTVFHRLVFNLKRILNKLPFGKTKLASYAAALFLIKENTNLTEDDIRKVLDKVLEDIDESLNEDVFYVKEGILNPGKYKLTTEVVCPKVGELIGLINDEVEVPVHTVPVGSMFKTPIYKVKHTRTQQDLYISSGDIKR